MNHLIHELFVKIKSDNKHIRGNAITDISFVLEMNSRQLPLEERTSKYDIYIEQELININLTQSEEAEIVEFLRREIINLNKSTSSLLFTIGKASSKTALIPLLDIIQNYSCDFDENDSYQALVSLERLLFWDDYGLSDDEKRNIISQTNPTPFIEGKLAMALDNPSLPYSSGLRDTAERLLDFLHESGRTGKLKFDNGSN